MEHRGQESAIGDLREGERKTHKTDRCKYTDRLSDRETEFKGRKQVNRNLYLPILLALNIILFLCLHLNAMHILLSSTPYCRAQEGQASCSSIVQVLNRITEGHKASLFHTHTHIQAHRLDLKLQSGPRSTRTHHPSALRIRTRAMLGQACRSLCWCIVQILTKACK